MNQEKRTPHYIEVKLKSQYIQHRTILKLGVAEAIDATKNWAVKENQYALRVSEPSNEWLEELDKTIRDIAKEVDGSTRSRLL